MGGCVWKERLERILVTGFPLDVATGDGCTHIPGQRVGDRAQTLPSTHGLSRSRVQQGVLQAQLDLGCQVLLQHDALGFLVPVAEGHSSHPYLGLTSILNWDFPYSFQTF